MAKTKRNDPCPCGSGKKYKYCCFMKYYEEVKPDKKRCYFTMDDGSKVSRVITSIDSIPTHNKNGLSPNITAEQMMDLCLDEIFKILVSEKVGMAHDLVDKVIREMDIIPTFTYRQIAERMSQDGRFNVHAYQICSLKGTDPVALIEERLANYGGAM